MKKKVKKEVLIAIVSALILFILIISFYGDNLRTTGNAVSDARSDANQVHTIGPSSAEQACMMSCMKCTSPGVGCTGDSATCQTRCNMQKPETTQETSCMEKCVLVSIRLGNLIL